MLWVKGAVLTLMERSQPLCWPHCLQCNLETAPRSMPGAEPAVQRWLKIYHRTPQKVCLSVCLLKPFPSFAPASRHVPVGLGAAMAPGIVAGSPGVSQGQPCSFSCGVGCKGCAALPARPRSRARVACSPLTACTPALSRCPPSAVRMLKPASPLSRSGHGGSADLPVLPAGAGGRGRR